MQVGSNGVLELDFAIDRDGLVNPEHEKIYRALGGWIRSCYGKSNVVSSVENATAKAMPAKDCPAGAKCLLLGGSGLGAKVDRVVLREDQRYGQNILSYSVEQHVKAKWQPIANGTGNSVGNRKVCLALQAALPACCELLK